MKPKTGSGTKLEDAPAHLAGISMVKLSDIISRPHQIVPERGAIFNVWQYAEIEKHFDNVKNIDRVKLLDKFAIWLPYELLELLLFPIVFYWFIII